MERRIRFDGYELTEALTRRIFQVTLLKIILIVASCVAFLLLLTLEKGDLNIFQYLGLVFCPLIFLGASLGFLHDAFKIKTAVIIGISAAVYAALNVLYMIIGWRSDSVLMNVGFIVITLIVEIPLLIGFVRIYNSLRFYRAVKKANKKNIDKHQELLRAKQIYNNKISEYNTVSQSIISASEKLKMKKPKLKEKSEYIERFSIPGISGSKLNFFYEHDNFDIKYFLEETERYAKKIDSEIADIEHKSMIVDENKALSVEVNRTLSMASDPRLSEQSQKTFKDVAKKMYRDLKKGNKNIKE